MAGKSSALSVLRLRSLSWPALAVGILLIQGALGLTIPQGRFLTAYSNIIYLFILLSATGVAALNAVQNRQSIRLFWSFLAAGCALWLLNPLSWLFTAPSPKGISLEYLLGASPLFLHIVLMIAAVASRPHLKSLNQNRYRTTLNFLLLLFFGIFLYAFLLFPYQHSTISSFVLRFEIFYAAENLLLLAGLSVLVVQAQPPWKYIYRHLLGASILYAIGSLAVNISLAYRGTPAGLVAIPSTAAGCWFVWVTLEGRKLGPQLAQTAQVDVSDGWFSSNLAILAALTIPCIGVWELFRVDEPDGTRTARLLIVLIFIVFLTVAASIRHYLVSRELSSDVGLAQYLLRLAMQSGHAVVWDLDVRTGRDTWSGDLVNMFGIPSDTYSGKVEDFYRFVHPEDRGMVAAAVTDAKVSGAPFRAEFRIVRPDGVVRWVSASGRFYNASNGDPVRMLGLVVDMSEHKRADDRFRLAVEAASNGMVMVNSQGTIVLVNSQAERIFGYQREELLGQSVELLVPEVSRTQHSGLRDDYGKEPEARTIGRGRVVYGQRKDGAVFPIEVGLTPIETPEGHCVVSSIVDITERNRTELVLRESEERFRLVANTAPVMIWMSGVDKLCTYFNQPWLEFTGKPLEAELGNGWAEGVHREDLKTCLDTYTAAFDRREPFKMQYRLRRHDGEYRWVFDIGVPRFNLDGSFAGYIGSCTDVSDRKLAEEALAAVSGKLIEAQEEERRRIARELHDDISQRLALLAILLEQMKDELPAADVSGRHRGDDLLKMTGEISSDVQAISHELHSSKLDLLGLAAAMKGFCREFSEQQRVEVKFTANNVPSGLSKEISIALFRVLQEGLRNAVKHSGVREFVVQLQGLPGELVLAIHDSGIGFNPAVVDKNSRGLGLVGMQERMHLVHGKLSVISKPNSGTEIRVSVPCDAASSTPQNRAAGV